MGHISWTLKTKEKKVSQVAMRGARAALFLAALVVVALADDDQDDTDTDNQALCRIECAKTNPDEADKLIDILCNCAVIGSTASMSDGATRRTIFPRRTQTTTAVPTQAPTTTTPIPTTTNAAAPSAAAFKITTTADICDYLCSVGLGGDACLCSKP